METEEAKDASNLSHPTNNQVGLLSSAPNETGGKRKKEKREREECKSPYNFQNPLVTPLNFLLLVHSHV
jgi:hypothetical protein